MRGHGLLPVLKAGCRCVGSACAGAASRGVGVLWSRQRGLVGWLAAPPFWTLNESATGSLAQRLRADRLQTEAAETGLVH